MDELESHVAGRATPDADPRLRRHVDACSTCAAWLATVDDDEVLADQLRRARVGSSGRFDAPVVTPVHAVARAATTSAGGVSAAILPIIPGLQIVRKLGEGGMGTVFEARQEHPRRDVAVKVLRGGAWQQTQYARYFQREVAALARLRHPGIAAVHAAGTTADGQHYFVMELVRGQRLDAYADGLRRHRVAPRELLPLFVRICEAVNYAHQRGVIHRDLKPANILVSEELQIVDCRLQICEEFVARPQSVICNLQSAIPKVLDFGLAKLVDADDDAANATRTGSIQGTLAYMSPEQVSADSRASDVRSDVYALGVVLYELLTGVRPYEVSASRVHEAARTICETRPRRPSLANPALRGDIETIILKALEKEPSRRYESAAALRDDLVRFVQRRPILARRPSAAYQFRLLAARHKLASGLALALLVLTVGFAVAMSVLYRHAAQARSQAEAERAAAVAARQSESTARLAAEKDAATARGIQRCIEETLGALNPFSAEERDFAPRDVLDELAARLETARPADAVVEASLRNVLGVTYCAFGLFDKAEQQLRTALRLRCANLGEVHPDTLNTQLQLALTLFPDPDRDAHARWQEAEVLVRHVYETRREALGEHNAETMAAANALAKVLQASGRFAQAERLLRQILTPERTTIDETRPQALAAMHTLGQMLSTRGRRDEAEPLLREVYAVRRQALGPTHPDTLVAMVDLGTLLGRTPDDPRGVDLCRDALVLIQQRFGPSHPRTLLAMNRLGKCLEQQGCDDAAEAVYRERLQWSRAAGSENSRTALVAKTLLARLLARHDRLTEAETLYREALQGKERLYGVDSPAAQAARKALDAAVTLSGSMACSRD